MSTMGGFDRSVTGNFFARWCFYCREQHDDLREHIMTEHPRSKRADAYRAESGVERS